jgi:glycosyltransferase involved in cell wall biosynthesis
LARFRFLWERLVIFFYNGFARRNLFRVSIANTGFNLSEHPLVKQADIIHLHWLNHGFLSLKNIKKLIELNKPVVWTLHDMWVCTGICHHARDCEKYVTQCHSCFYLKSKSSKDLSTFVFNRKKKIFTSSALSIVTCSKWLQSKVQKSELLKNHFNISIPNPINTQIYAPRDKNECRLIFNLPQNKFLLLFGAANSTDERKGLSYFLESLEILQKQHPDIFERIEIVVFGEMKQELKQRIIAPIHVLGYISDEEKIVKIYNAADIFVISSLDENLPNTIMEAMACGTPCLGFNTGGIPEMIDHQQNGYVAEYKNVQDMAHGIRWILNEADYRELSNNARKKVENYYSEEIVAEQYIHLYKELTQLS